MPYQGLKARFWLLDRLTCGSFFFHFAHAKAFCFPAFGFYSS
jgi:hypothetical protein